MTVNRVRPRAPQTGGSIIIEPGGGDVDANAPTGTDSQSQSGISVVGDSLPMGTDSQSMAIPSVVGNVPTGTETEEMAMTDESGTGTISTGTESESANAVSITGPEVASGEESESMSVSAVVEATGFPSTSTATDNGGTVNWASPTLAANNNDDEASITVAASPTAAASSNDDLRILGFALGVAPTGWTRSKVELLIRHRWDLTVGPLSTASIVVTVRNSASVILATPINRAQGSGDQTTLLTEAFDITAAVAALTDVQLQGIRVWCTDVSNLLIATGGNHVWAVAWAHIRVTYTKAGIT